MKLLIPKCPQCGNPAVGTVDTVPGVALFDGNPSTGEVNYAGTTEVDWDGQETRKQEANPLVTCGDHEWATAIEGLEDR